MRFEERRGVSQAVEERTIVLLEKLRACLATPEGDPVEGALPNIEDEIDAHMNAAVFMVAEIMASAGFQWDGTVVKQLKEVYDDCVLQMVEREAAGGIH